MANLALNPETYDKSQRVDWVDYAKGFCILFVVMMHATLGVEKHAFEKGLVSEGPVGWMNTIVTFAQPFRMPDFFMISGLFLGLVIARSWLRYVDRKVVHFFYFYVLWLIVQFTFRSIGWIGEGLGPIDIIGKFGVALIEPYGTLWFIYMLPVMFVVTRLLTRIHWGVVLGFAALLEIAPIHTGWLLVDEFASRYVYFFAGFALAQPIFRLATWARDNTGKALAYLGVWGIVNGLMTLTAFPGALSGLYTSFGRSVPVNIAQMPIVSLALGTAGAVAVICLCSVLSRFKLASFLRYLGSHSIVVYLAFFLPMVISREILFRFAPWIDLGTMSLIVLTVSVLSSVIAWEFTRITGWFKFFFIRPKWACIDREDISRNSKASLQPAE
ncbi:MAG: acyltransferase family protein [Rhizobiaceae bacterium]|nr:acyltransferase family protein [Rhizobiaceae bacterium]